MNNPFAKSPNKIRIIGFLRKCAYVLLNPRLVLCLGLGWMITNGWSYVITALGIWLDIPWMTAVGGAYLSLLWFPCTPEKLFTVIIALFLLKKLFPGDTRTLQVLEQEYAHAKAAIGHLNKKRNHPSK